MPHIYIYVYIYLEPRVQLPDMLATERLVPKSVRNRKIRYIIHV